MNKIKLYAKYFCNTCISSVSIANKFYKKISYKMSSRAIARILYLVYTNKNIKYL